MSNTQLIHKISQGDRAAQMQLYDLYSKELYNTALRIVRDSFAAEEIMQDTLIKLFKNPTPYLKEPQKLLYSLKRIAINHSIDWLRAKRVRFEEIERLPRGQQLEPDVEIEELYTEENLSRLNLAIISLPLGYQTILTLKIMEEMTTEEIAQKLKITPTTVRTQLHRAKQKLKELIR